MKEIVYYLGIQTQEELICRKGDFRNSFSDKISKSIIERGPRTQIRNKVNQFQNTEKTETIINK